MDLIDKTLLRIKEELCESLEPETEEALKKFLSKYTDVKKEKQYLVLISVASRYALDPLLCAQTKQTYADAKKRVPLKPIAEKYDPTLLIEHTEQEFPKDFALKWIETKFYKKFSKRVLWGYRLAEKTLEKIYGKQ